jgi:hypothetical protein
VKFGHNIPKLWAERKNRDAAFLTQFALRPSVLARDLLDVKSYEQLAPSDFKHFLFNAGGPFGSLDGRWSRQKRTQLRKNLRGARYLPGGRSRRAGGPGTDDGTPLDHRQ